MDCPVCDNPHSWVVYTRHYDMRNGGQKTERRRECVKCGARYTTIEVPKVKEPKNAK